MEIVQVEDIPELSDIKKVLVDDKQEQMLAYRTCKQMEAVCDENNGIGLNAVQVGIPWRLFIIKTNDKFEHFLNCTYEPVGEDKVTSIEGCLSLKDASGEFRKFEMTRSLIVKVTGQKLVAESGLTVEDFSAYIHAEDQGVVFQHEIDHDLGPEGLISNKGKEVFIW
jgi:peptide deformylase